MGRTAIDMRDLGLADWTKGSLDLCLGNGEVPTNVEEMRLALEADGTTVEHFKSLPSYGAALERNPWLAEL